MIFFDQFPDKNNFQFQLFHLVKNFFCSDKTVISIVCNELFLMELHSVEMRSIELFSAELFLFISEIKQNYIIVFF